MNASNLIGNLPLAHSAMTPLSVPPASSTGDRAVGADPMQQLAPLLQQLIRQATQQHTSLPQPQEQAGPHSPYNPNSGGNQHEQANRFFYNLGATIQNAGLALKERQIKQATGTLQTLNGAWEHSQQLAGGDTQKAQAIFQQLPQVQTILSDPKQVKQLSNLLRYDALNPEKNKTSMHVAAERVSKADKLRSAMGAVQDAITRHGQQQQQYTPEQVSGIAQRLTSRAVPQAPDLARERTALSTLLQEAKNELSASKTLQDQKLAQEKVDLLQQQLDGKNAQFDEKLKTQQDEFEKKQATQADQFKQRISEARFDATLRANTARDINVIRAKIQRDVAVQRISGPTQQARNNSQGAGIIISQLPRIKQEISDLGAKGKLGVIAGRYEDFLTGKVGQNDPDFSALRADLGLMSLDSLHTLFGTRGGSTLFDKFSGYFNQAGASAANLNSSLERLSDWMTAIQEMGTGQASSSVRGSRTPPIGTVEDGYRFIGGDPSSRSNWNKVQ